MSGNKTGGFLANLPDLKLWTHIAVMIRVLAICRGSSIGCAVSNVVANIKQHVHPFGLRTQLFCRCSCLRYGINGDIDGLVKNFNMHTVKLQSLRRPVAMRVCQPSYAAMQIFGSWLFPLAEGEPFHLRITVALSFQSGSRVPIATPVLLLRNFCTRR
jgi:hypothetical protein